jgi:oligoendopeptidase F
MEQNNIPDRTDVPAEHKWDLTPLFASDNDWEAAYSEIETALKGYARYQGQLKTSAKTLADALDFHLDLSRRIEKLFTYAHLKSDEDKANSVYLGLYQRALNIYTRASQQASFMVPEIQQIPDNTIARFEKDPLLDQYRFYLFKILREKAHTLDQAGEKILAMSQEMAQTASQVFGQLDNVDLTFGEIADEKGAKMPLTHGNFISFLSKPERSLRKKAFFQYYKSYEAHQHTLAATLAQAVKKDIFYSRVRHFETCRSKALFADDVPENVYDNLMTTVKNNLAPLFKYMRLRKKSLKLKTMHIYDTYVPLITEVPFNMSYAEAVETSLAALVPLGATYCATLAKGLRGSWVDRYENRGKRSGAYSSGCYDSPPYILLNYRDDTINSLYTLIHEAGHSMHSHYARKHQPYVDHDYTIFVAEVASTFNEVLLSRHLLDHYKDDARMQAYIINREIDNIRATLFRQTMFAEFEQILHARAEKNSPLTIETIREIYRNLLNVYFGDTIQIDPQLELEALRIPHFYSAFYVYKYATGISAAIALANDVMDPKKASGDVYLDFLKSGGTKFPLNQLADAGVDMRTAEPIEQAIAYFANLVDRLEALEDLI